VSPPALRCGKLCDAGRLLVLSRFRPPPSAGASTVDGVAALTPFCAPPARFRIEDENTKFYDITKQATARNYNLAAWACIRLDRLRPGYRFLHLLDGQGNPTQGKLLILVEKTTR